MSATQDPALRGSATRESSALDAATLCEAFQRTAARYGENVALRTPDDQVSITWTQYAARVQRLAAGLAALGVSRAMKLKRTPIGEKYAAEIDALYA